MRLKSKVLKQNKNKQTNKKTEIDSAVTSFS